VTERSVRTPSDNPQAKFRQQLGRLGSGNDGAPQQRGITETKAADKLRIVEETLDETASAPSSSRRTRLKEPSDIVVRGIPAVWLMMVAMQPVGVESGASWALQWRRSRMLVCQKGTAGDVAPCA
jgi:hypothetical protein